MSDSFVDGRCGEAETGGGMGCVVCAGQHIYIVAPMPRMRQVTRPGASILVYVNVHKEKNDCLSIFKGSARGGEMRQNRPISPKNRAFRLD